MIRETSAEVYLWESDALEARVTFHPDCVAGRYTIEVAIEEGGETAALVVKCDKVSAQKVLGAIRAGVEVAEATLLEVAT